MKRICVFFCMLLLATGIVYATNPVLVDSAGSGNFTTVQAAIDSWCAGGTNAGETPPFVINIKAGSGPYDEMMDLNDVVTFTRQSTTSIAVDTIQVIYGPISTVSTYSIWTNASGLGYDFSTGASIIQPNTIVLTNVLPSSPIPVWVTYSKSSIVGALEIKSDTPGTRVIFKLRRDWLGASPYDDGLTIHQSNYDITFRDIIICPSLYSQVTDDLVKVDENYANNNFNTISFYNCIFTEIKTDGSPMVTSREEAAGPPTTARGSAMGPGSDGDDLLKCWNDAGESYKIMLKDCIFYYSPSYNAQLCLDGQGGEIATVDNCVSSYAGYCDYIVRGYYANQTVIFKGNSIKNGITDGNWILNPLGGGHGIYVNGAINPFILDISSTVISSDTTASSRGISCNTATTLILKDSIIQAPNYLLVGFHTMNIQRCTLHNTTPSSCFYSAGGYSNATIRDCIITGPGTKFTGTAPTGGISVDYCGLPQYGTYTIGARGTIATFGANNVIYDPMYLSAGTTLSVVTSTSFMDIRNGIPAIYGYKGAGTGATDLSGGADYIGDVGFYYPSQAIPTVAATGTYPFYLGGPGAADTSYCSIIVNSITGSAGITMAVTDAKHPQTSTFTFGSTYFLSRYFTITTTAGITAIDYNLNLGYSNGDLADAGLSSESIIEIAKYDGTWSFFAADTRDTAANWVQKNGLTSFSDWTLSGPAGVPVELSRFSTEIIREK
ncbi:MAG: hypothetical protein ACE14V_09345 [bacterium]